MLTATADRSLRPMPSNITRPAAISPVTAPSTVTRARLTRWTTARIFLATRFSAADRQAANRLCVILGGQRRSPTRDSSFDSQSVFRLFHRQQRHGLPLVARAHF